MEIKKVLNLSQEEFDVVIKAGEILGGINKSLESKEADEVLEGVANLVKAIANISTKVLSTGNIK